MKRNNISSRLILFTLLQQRPRLSIREMLTVALPVKIFLSIYGTRNFIAVFTSARHWSLSSTVTQFTCSHPISSRSILILSFHLRQVMPSELFPSSILIFCMHFSSLPFMLHCPHISFSARYIVYLWCIDNLYSYIYHNVIHKIYFKGQRCKFNWLIE
jgi:hypothetical protein